MGLNDTEQNVVNRSKDVWNALNNKQSQYQGDVNLLENQIGQKIDPLYAGLQEFGRSAKEQADQLSWNWGQAGQAGQKDLGDMATRAAWQQNDQTARWNQQAGNIATEGGAQRNAWDQNLAKVGDVANKQNQSWADFLSGVQPAKDQATENYAKPKSYYESQLEDPSKRGFDPTTLQGMYARGAEQAQAGQANSARQIAKLTAASGTGGTGAAFKNLQQAQSTAQQQQLSNARDVGIAQGTAQREDLASALQGLTGIGTASNADQAKLMGIDLSGRQAQTEGERANLGLEQAGIGQSNADVRNLLSLGTQTETNRAADLADLLKQQQSAYQAKSDIGMQGLAGQGQAQQIGNAAQEAAFSGQNQTLGTLKDYMNQILGTQQAGSQDLMNMLATLDPQLKASALDRGDKGIWETFANQLTAAGAKALGSWVTKPNK
jgi:hypothetical protein